MSQHTPISLPETLPGARVAIITAEWNQHINQRLTDSATERLHRFEAEYDLFTVPGAIELTYAAALAADSRRYDAVIVFGTVIRGGTPHFDYVCQSVTQGITQLNAKGGVPVIFGVLTVDCEQDAIDRAGGPVGDKGSECADAALKMAALARKFAQI